MFMYSKVFYREWVKPVSYSITRRNALKGTAMALAGLPMVGSVSARSDTLAKELNTVRAATRKYKDVAVAQSDGYGVGSPYVPGMGFHFVNGGLVASDEDVEGDLTQPAILVYVPTGNYRPEPGEPHDPDRDSDLRLAAVEFAHGGTLGAAADYFSDDEASRTLKVSEEDGWEPIPGSPLTALHVWVHRGNPAGVFHPTNPTVA